VGAANSSNRSTRANEAEKYGFPIFCQFGMAGMMNSPFTFYRGAAINMAVDLATTPAMDT
jgi:uncharacterized protein (DUF2252 family)